MRKNVVALVAVLFAAVGCGAQDGTPGTDTSSIIGGATDTGDPSVVALFAHLPGQNQGSLCTATVISARTLLTAAHCVDPAVVGAGNVFEAFAGTNFDSTAVPLPATSGTTFDPGFNPNNLTGGHDVGLVFLSANATQAPIPYNHTASNIAAGNSVRLVGYGTNTHANAGAGVKRTLTTTIDDLSQRLVHIGSSNKQTCHGDSGGPAFKTINGVATVIGVTSFGQDQSATSVCFGGGQDTRIDFVASFIDANKR